MASFDSRYYVFPLSFTKVAFLIRIATCFPKYQVVQHKIWVLNAYTNDPQCKLPVAELFFPCDSNYLKIGTTYFGEQDN